MNDAEKWQMGGVKSYEVIDQTEAVSDLSMSAGSGWQDANNPPEVTEGAESRRVLVVVKGYGHGPHCMIGTWYNAYGLKSESMWIVEDDCNHDKDQVTHWMDFPSFPNERNNHE